MACRRGHLQAAEGEEGEEDLPHHQAEGAEEGAAVALAF